MSRQQAKRWCFTLNNPLDTERIDPDLCDYMIAGEEVGDQGTRHFQGYCEFTSRKQLSAVKKILPRAHWEVAKGTPYDNFIYCSKDGKFVESGDRPRAPKKSKDKDTTYAEAIQASTVQEGIAIVKQKRPRDYCLHGESIERNLKRAKHTPFVHKYTGFNRDPLPLQKTLLFYGDSNTGKTHFACSHFKNPLVCSHIDKLKTLSPDHDGIVFDDMSFKHWPIESVIHLLDQEFEREINIRYGTTIIPANTPKIFTHNTANPFYQEEANEEQKTAIERRLQRVHIHNKLY
uniref:hypothetical protein n=1 Tax=Roseivirga sp. TaxID=1964215 RepID=UPI0040487C94